MALWLPALAGEMVGTDEERERFLFDWRQTLGELLAENHYDLATEIFHSHGIKRYSESHEERRSFTGDGMMVKRTADVPQGAFWVRFRAGVYATMPHMEADLRESSSVAHIYGQNICAAEAFTTNGRPGKFHDQWPSREMGWMVGIPVPSGQAQAGRRCGHGRGTQQICDSHFSPSAVRKMQARAWPWPVWPMVQQVRYLGFRGPSLDRLYQQELLHAQPGPLRR